MDDTRQWFVENSSGNLSIATTAGKYGGGALALASGSADTVFNTFASGLSSGNTICASFMLKTSAATKPTNGVYFFGIGSATANHSRVSSDSDVFPTLGISIDGRLNLALAGSIGTEAYVDINVCDGLWHHVEIAVKTDNSTGISRLIVDGVESLQSITSGDTLTLGANSDARDRVICGTNTAQQTTFYIDDLLIYDDVSSGIAGDLTYTSNFPLGEVRIETIQPNGVGTNSDWTPTSGDNYTNVDEDVADDDTTIVATGTATDLDTYAFSNLSGTPSSIYGVMIGSVGKASPGATTGIKHYTLSSAATDESAEITLIGAYQFNQTFVGQDPNTTAAWTEAGVNAAEFGIEKQ